MNAENFADFLKDYSKLYQLPYEELKSLVLQYPYCSNLHYLLAEKSQLDQHKDLDQHIRTASFYSQDRASLRKLIQKLKVVARQMESFELAEDYLELKDLSSIDQVEPLFAEDALSTENESAENIPELFSTLTDIPEFSDNPEEHPPTEEHQEPLDLSQIDTSEPEPTEDESLEESPEQAGENLEELFEQLMAHAPPIEEIEKPSEFNEPIIQEDSLNEEDLPSPAPDTLSIDKSDDSSEASQVEDESIKSEDAMETPKEITSVPFSQPRPTPKSSFTSWVQQFQPAHVKVQLSELMESKKREDAKKAKKKKKKKKKDRMVLFAEKSLKEPKDLATESLAELLVSQEQYAKAIEMYQRLILKFPEKSSYFADKINNLKNL